MMTKRVSVARCHLVEEVAEAVDVVIVERGRPLRRARRSAPGLVRNTAKISASAVSRLLDRPTSSDKVAGFLPGRLGDEFPGRPRAGPRCSMSCSSAVPPPNSWANRRWKVRVDHARTRSSRRSRASRLRLWMPWTEALDRLDEVVALGGERGVLGLDAPADSSSARRLTAPSRSRSRRRRSSVDSISARSGSGSVGFISASSATAEGGISSMS